MQWLKKISRQTVIFIGGLLGVLHETVVYHPNERPFLLAIFGAMMGLPFVIKVDQTKSAASQTENTISSGQDDEQEEKKTKKS